MIRINAFFAICTTSLVMLTACGTGDQDTPEQGDITAQITCSAQDSLLATLYMAGGDMAAASEWCSCAGSDACSIEFSSLGLGDYVLSVGIPDSTYFATEGAEGFVRPLGFYGDNELAQDIESATVITLSDDQPHADAVVNLRDDGSTNPN